MWIGSYDPFTLLCWALAIVAWTTGSRTLLVGAGMTLGFQHFEQASLGVLALWCTWLALRSSAPALADLRTSPLWLLPGIIAGKVLLTAMLFQGNGTGLEARSQWVSHLGLGRLVGEAAGSAPVMLWSFLCGAWLLAVIAYLAEPEVKGRLLLLAAFALIGLPAFVSIDHTRVFTMIGAPSLVLLIAWFSEWQRTVRDRRLVVAIETLQWLAVPIVVWGSTVGNV
jgi:hypothetical protein